MCSHLEKYALECGGGLGFWNSVMRKSVTSKKKTYISSLCEYFMKVDGYEKRYLWTISMMQNRRNALSSWKIMKMKRWSSPLRDESNHDLEIQKSWYINDQIQCIRIVPHNKSHHVILQFHSVSRYQRHAFWFGPKVGWTDLFVTLKTVPNMIFQHRSVQKYSTPCINGLATVHFRKLTHWQ